MAKVIRKELEAKLAALGGEEWDSMSEGSVSGDEAGAQLDGELKPPPLPLRAQKKKKGAKKGKAAGASVVPVGPAGEPSGVVYVGHIPHGFYEEAMNGFFKQFGDVIRVRISRSKKSARCKGYAYVEFTSPEVAGIVAETMNGYYLFDKQLVCRVLRFEEVHPSLFDGAGVKFRKVNWHGLYREKYNADRTPAKDEQHVAKLLGKDKAKRAKLAALGIEYDFPGFVASLNDREVEAGPFQGKKKRKSEGEEDDEEDSTPASKRRSKSGDADASAPAAQPDTTAPPSSSKKLKTKGKGATATKAAAGKGDDSTPPVKANSKSVSNAKKSPGKGNPPSAKKAKPSKVVESPAGASPTPAAAAAGVSPAGKKRSAKTPPQKKRKPSAGEEEEEKSAAGDIATPLRAGANATEGKGKGSASKKGPKTPPTGGAKAGGVGSEGGKGKSPKSGARKRSSQQAQEEEGGGVGEGEGEGSAKGRRAKRARA